MIYSLKKDGNNNITKYHQVKDFRCHDGSNTIVIDIDLIVKLTRVEDECGEQTITSAYRTKAYNKKVGGVSNSQHLFGNAVDVIGKDLKKITKVARGVGLYVIVYNNFLHLDTRNINPTLSTLRKGSKGSLVVYLQEILNARGYKLKADGKFGKITQANVKLFQKHNGLTVDGVVGKKTWSKLI